MIIGMKGLGCTTIRVIEMGLILYLTFSRKINPTVRKYCMSDKRYNDLLKRFNKGDYQTNEELEELSRYLGETANQREKMGFTLLPIGVMKSLITQAAHQNKDSVDRILRARNEL